MQHHRGGDFSKLCQVLLTMVIQGTTEWFSSTIRSNHCGTNGMGLKTTKTSMWLVDCRNGEALEVEMAKALLAF
jgi:hypothetical protein